jgi:soluble lytic murein transglycosylase-like protein
MTTRTRRLWRYARHALAVLGALALIAAVVLVAVPSARARAELALLEWMTRRALAEVERELGVAADPGAALRAAALDPASLPPAQAAVAAHLAARYRVAAEPMAAIVAEAYRLGPRLGLPPNLLLAVAAVESRFHPYVQSAAGAQGLMQIMTRVHRARLDAEGGEHVVFDPLVSLRVGAKILHDCVKLTGSTEEGLRFYLGGHGTDRETGQGYLDRIREIQQPLDQLSPPPRASAR